jgi:hypothetical protein
MLALLPLMLGFASTDLNRLDGEIARLLGPGFLGAPRPGKLAYSCPSCAGEPILGIEIGRQADGTEDRVRSGRTRIEDLEKQCQARSPECRIEALAAGPAVGWVSSYALGSSRGATAILILGGDLLTIRAVANDAATARGTIDRLMPLVREKIVGG